KGRVAGDLPELVDGVLFRKRELPCLASLGAGCGDEGPDALALSCPCDEVDPRRPLQDLVAGNLRDATGDADDEVRVVLLPAREDSETAEHLGLGLLPHRARIEQHDAR